MNGVEDQGVGCRAAAVAVGFLVFNAAVLFGVGLWLTLSDTCTGVCGTVGFTLLYAGGPISAIFGVLTGALVAAWPLDLVLWITLGFVFARIAGDDLRRIVLFAAASETAALVYGFALSFLVVRA